MSRAWRQALFSGAQRHGEKQYRSSKTQIPQQYEEELLYTAGGRAAREVCSPPLWTHPKPTRTRPCLPGSGDPALLRRLAHRRWIGLAWCGRGAAGARSAVDWQRLARAASAMADEELEALRQRRLGELRAEHGYLISLECCPTFVLCWKNHQQRNWN
ncbi:programmed cell death protein 5 isoform X3 [Onychostruthus taczanowskii]|uniref:programmed cell death protein 5 isoform X3 n=1 Tax=Onychostruthus taczanowskii TaxID=356909 RepID=UPI001B808416|nr:programmed cell death protein 5 isoform X3 [Onychostruthus taczanowskii]